MCSTSVKAKNHPILLRQSVFSSLYVHGLSLCLTGAVGLPLPGVEVRIVMNNTINTTIVEGTHKETQVIHKFNIYRFHQVKSCENKGLASDSMQSCSCC